MMESACQFTFPDRSSAPPEDVLILNRPNFMARKRFIYNVQDLQAVIRSLGASSTHMLVPPTPCEQVCGYIFQLLYYISSWLCLVSMYIHRKVLLPHLICIRCHLALGMGIADQAHLEGVQGHHYAAWDAYGQLYGPCALDRRHRGQPTQVPPSPLLQAQGTSSALSICVSMHACSSCLSTSIYWMSCAACRPFGLLETRYLHLYQNF